MLEVVVIKKKSFEQNHYRLVKKKSTINQNQDKKEKIKPKKNINKLKIPISCMHKLSTN